ncbi:phage capsid family protein [Helicobacter cetorum]|uniref:DUF4043 family protein n=1 Tax=Helicobacter cetorum (strain ATCC BAA-540 / CCUG 52418 / MIT 99-5656) TaxID=1163745 RepID=I0EQJ8_HELCM|nr:DUF4043 family protein [Helicobacter cetorum]AFI05217.1 hypothetical protein HCD_00925 [Helicobacter cetorum MIT 99-5656]AFI06007.1 hypothetical protein HCD_05025 [Helicobacter cetorum MIT 99-5656]
MLNLNQVDFNNISSNPQIGREVALQIENASWKKSLFESITGKGEDRAIRTYTTKTQNPFVPRLKTPLMGRGVVGNTDFIANLDNLEILSQTIYPEAFGNSAKSKIKAYEDLENTDFIKETCDSLSNWMGLERDKRIIAAMTNDFSNVLYTPQMNVATIRKAIFNARNGLKADGTKTFPIKPIMASMEDAGKGVIAQNSSYIVLLDSYQASQLKADPEFKDIQKIYAYAGLDRGLLYKGFCGVIDNCVIIDAGIWTSLNSGMPNSTIDAKEFSSYINKANVESIVTPSDLKATLKTKNATEMGESEISIGCLIGASSVLMAHSPEITFYIDENQDAGRKSLVGIDCIMGVSKARFVGNGNAANNLYNNQDFSVIGLVTNMQEPSKAAAKK